ncbi:hypothetical protein OAA99_00600 [Omnitrophica bacterium]|nr:hypothetical protein [Candidatus Omnitrophota bacterium]MDB4349432.1 hypothetical protein [Candidatus Omnitrophota bacterium]
MTIKCEKNKCIDGIIEELQQLDIPKKQQNIKNDFIGQMKRLKGGMRGGTIKDGKFYCNDCGKEISPDHLILGGKNKDKHYHALICFTRAMERHARRGATGSRVRSNRSKTPVRIKNPTNDKTIEKINKAMEAVHDGHMSPRTNMEVARQLLAIQADAARAAIQLTEIQRDALHSSIQRILLYISQIGLVSVGGITAYGSYHMTAIITGYLLQWTITSFPSWISYEQRKAGERAEQEMRNFQNDMKWRADRGLLPKAREEPPEPQAIGCSENPNGVVCAWNEYWGNIAELDNQGYLVLPDTDPTGEMNQDRWDTFRLGARRIWERGRNYAEGFWQDLTHNPLNAFQTIGLVGDMIIRVAHLIDNVLPVMVAVWVFYFFLQRALALGPQKSEPPTKPKKEGGRRKLRKKTRRKRRKTRRKSKRRKRKRKRKTKRRKRRR